MKQLNNKKKIIRDQTKEKKKKKVFTDVDVSCFIKQTASKSTERDRLICILQICDCKLL